MARRTRARIRVVCCAVIAAIVMLLWFRPVIVSFGPLMKVLVAIGNGLLVFLGFLAFVFVIEPETFRDAAWQRKGRIDAESGKNDQDTVESRQRGATIRELRKAIECTEQLRQAVDAHRQELKKQSEVIRQGIDRLASLSQEMNQRSEPVGVQNIAQALNVPVERDEAAMTVAEHIRRIAASCLGSTLRPAALKELLPAGWKCETLGQEGTAPDAYFIAPANSAELYVVPNTRAWLPFTKLNYFDVVSGPSYPNARIRHVKRFPRVSAKDVTIVLEKGQLETF